MKINALKNLHHHPA